MKIYIDTTDIDNTLSITELPEDTNLNEAADDFGGAIACLFVDFLRKFKLKDVETLDFAHNITLKYMNLYIEGLFDDYKDDFEKHSEEAILYGYMEKIFEKWVIEYTQFNSIDEFVEYYRDTEVMNVSTKIDHEIIISLKNDEVEQEIYRRNKKDFINNVNDVDRELGILEIIIVTALDKLFGENNNLARKDDSWKNQIKESLM